MSFKIVILSRSEASAKTVIEALDPSIGVAKVIVDPGASRKIIFTNRIKRVGILAFIGQLLFRFIAMPYLNSIAKKRKTEISGIYLRSRAPEPLPPVKYIENINSQEGSWLLNESAPDAIVVVTRRIISQGTLKRVPIRFINIHDGIVPKYRGLFGAYWAMVSKDPGNCGATVHFIDKGLDTGPIIGQTNIVNQLTDADNFTTYAMHQFASALPLLNTALLQMAHDSLKTKARETEVGKIRYIPTLWTYLRHRIGNGIK